MLGKSPFGTGDLRDGGSRGVQSRIGRPWSGLGVSAQRSCAALCGVALKRSVHGTPRAENALEL